MDFELRRQTIHSPSAFWLFRRLPSALCCLPSVALCSGAYIKHSTRFNRLPKNMCWKKCFKFGLQTAKAEVSFTVCFFVYFPKATSERFSLRWKQILICTRMAKVPICTRVILGWAGLGRGRDVHSARGWTSTLGRVWDAQVRSRSAAMMPHSFHVRYRLALEIALAPT